MDTSRPSPFGVTMLLCSALTCALPAAAAHADCVPTPLYITGNSLAPFITDGMTVKGWLGDCGDPHRGDLLLFSHLGFDLPLVKFVVAVPGDRFDLSPDGDGWNLIVNGEIARNAELVPYRLPPGHDETLRLYLRGTKGIIPPDAYLVMGDNPAGTDDSSRFGLVSRADIKGGASPPFFIPKQ